MSDCDSLLFTKEVQNLSIMRNNVTQITEAILSELTENHQKDFPLFPNTDFFSYQSVLLTTTCLYAIYRHTNSQV